MGIKIRTWRGKYYLVIHHLKRRYTKAIGPDVEAAKRKAEEVEIILKWHGVEGLRAWLANRPIVATTVKTYSEQFEKELEATDLKLSTKMSHQTILKNHIVPEFGLCLLSEVTYRDVKAWILVKAKKYSKNTCRLMIATGRSMFQEAVREGLVAANPFTGLSRFYRKSKTKEIERFTREDWAKVQAKIGEKYAEYLTLVKFMAGTGVRIGEALALKAGDIDWTKNEIHIRRNLPVHRKIETPKTTAGRRILEVSPALILDLKEHLAERRKLVFAKKADKCDWVFPTPAGEPIDYSRFHKKWDLAQTDAKVYHRRPHDLRHSWASWQLMDGKSLLWVSQQLGHSSPQVTLSIYARWIPGNNPTPSEDEAEVNETSAGEPK